MGSGTPVETVLKFRDKGISVEEARKQMLAAGEAPRGIQSETVKNRGVGGNTPADQAPAPPKTKFATRAQVTLLNEDGTDGDTTTIEAKSTQELDIQIKKLHAQAVVAKKNLRVELLGVDDEVVIAIPIEAIVGVPEKQDATPSAPPIETAENAKFKASIFQEDGEWVAEIVYKNGAGTERFSAPSRRELDLKVLEGKGHATLRVREAIRREKYGVELDTVYTIPDDVTQEEFDAMAPSAQRLVLDAVAKGHADEFKELHPEYYPTAGNSDRIQKFLKNQQNGATKGLPFTLRNLEFAFAELSEQDPQWEFRPEPKIVAPSVPLPAPLAEDSAVAPPAPAPASTVAAPEAPAVVVRKRGTTGLQPGQSSAGNSELDSTQEDGNKSREPSVAELRKSSPAGQPPSAALKAAFQASIAERKRQRQF